MCCPGDWWHPKWWKADTMSGQAVTLKNMEQVQNQFLASLKIFLQKRSVVKSVQQEDHCSIGHDFFLSFFLTEQQLVCFLGLRACSDHDHSP